MIWICASLVKSDSHRHHGIHELRPRVSGCIIALRWNILWKSRERKVPVKLPQLFSSCVRTPLKFPRDLIEELKPRSLSVLLFTNFTGIDLPGILLHTKSYDSLVFLSSPSSSLVLSLLLDTLFFHTFTHALFLSHWFHLHTYNFFWRLLYSKRHFLVRFFFFLEIMRPNLNYSDSRHCSANERRAFFYIYLLLHSSLRILMTIRTRETCVSLVFFLSCSLFSVPLRLFFFIEPFSFCFTTCSSRNSSAL